MNIHCVWQPSWNAYLTFVTFDDDPESYYEQWYNTKEDLFMAWCVDLKPMIETIITETRQEVEQEFQDRINQVVSVQ